MTANAPVLPWRDRSLAIAFGGVAFVSGTVAVVTYPAADFRLVALLATVAFVVERRSISLTGRLSVSATYVPIVLALVIGGPTTGIIVSAAGFLAHFRAPYARWFVWTCGAVISAALAGMAGWGVHQSPTSPRDVFEVTLVTGGLNVVVGLALATLTVAVRQGPWRETFAAGWSLVIWAATIYLPMIAALSYAYARASIWALLAVFPPLMAAQQLLVLYLRQRETAERLADAVEAAEATNRELEVKNAELETVNLSFAASLIVSLDARDHYTAGHSAAVAVYARDLAVAIGLDDAACRRAYLAGLVHDIGKVGLPPGILEKPTPLSDEEQAQMQQHVLIGERIVSPVRQFSDLAPAVRHHHERYDGRGYPDGLAGQGIPLLARIVSVADTYNAMTSDRPYRPALAPHTATANLENLGGTQLDPVFALTLVAVLRASDAAYRVARRSEFIVDFARLDDAMSLMAGNAQP
jgi:hypothetical protein